MRQRTIVDARREGRRHGEIARRFIETDATDDAALCERLGVPVFVVLGSERAMKVTTEADFARAEALSKLPG